MSRATTSTGKIAFGHKQRSPSSDSDEVFSLVILADFSGRDHRKLNDHINLSQRKIMEVDRDNFDEVFAQLDVQCQLPICDAPLVFTELDDMHPDFIYERVPLFEKFKQLKRKLKKKTSFAAATDEINQWVQAKVAEKTDTTAKNAGHDSEYQVSTLLDDMLSGQQTQSPKGFDTQALIKDIVAPYITEKPDPQLQDYLQTVDEASSCLMREIMHHRQFQTLEAAWRSLYLLVKRIETDKNLKIHIVDVSLQELIDDTLTSEDYEESQLYKLLVTNRQAPGTTPFSVIMVDAIFGTNKDGFSALSRLGEIVSTIDASCIAGGSEKLAGCESLVQKPDSDDWNFVLTEEMTGAWQSLRATSQANSIVLVAPRYLARMPYGKRSSPIESFDFEELPEQARHPYYLWGCGAWLLALNLSQNSVIARGQQEIASNEISGLPLHVYYEDETTEVTPCAEIIMFDSTASTLGAAGLASLRSIRDKDSILIPAVRSIALNKAPS